MDDREWLSNTLSTEVTAEFKIFVACASDLEAESTRSRILPARRKVTAPGLSSRAKERDLRKISPFGQNDNRLLLRLSVFAGDMPRDGCGSGCATYGATSSHR